MMVDQYNERLSRRFPGLFVILLDQSESMQERFPSNGLTKADIVTQQVNMVIQRMTESAYREEKTTHLRKHAYVCVLGYNDEARPLFNPPIKDIDTLDKNPLGWNTISENIYDRHHHLIRTVDKRHRVWIYPVTEGHTQMARAFEAAERYVEQWLHSTPEPGQGPRERGFPPIVLHVTDAKDSGNTDPGAIANRIRDLETRNGRVLLCNCHIDHQSRAEETCMFPVSLDDLKRVPSLKDDQLQWAENMFNMSSIMPEQLREEAERIMVTRIRTGARCFIYNADPEKLVQFLKWGTYGSSK